MSVLIKGMEMPVFEHQSWDIRKGADGKWYMVDTNAETSDGEWHEIIPVPPHGRLIDADKLGIRDAEKQAYEAYLREKGEDFIEEPIIEYHRGYLEGLTHASGCVKFAHTIIPASEEGK